MKMKALQYIAGLFIFVCYSWFVVSFQKKVANFKKLATFFSTLNSNEN